LGNAVEELVHLLGRAETLDSALPRMHFV